jgi:hypothetical protein
VKDFFKNISSLVIALLILLGILFIPETSYDKVDELLDFLSNSNSAAESFGYYLLQKLVTGAIVLTITILISMAAHRVYKTEREKEDVEEEK